MSELEEFFRIPPALLAGPELNPRQRWLDAAKDAGIFDGPSWAPSQIPPGLEWIEQWARS